jgi:hypothetical protein
MNGDARVNVDKDARHLLGIYFKRFAAEKSSYDKDGIGAESND